MCLEVHSVFPPPGLGQKPRSTETSAEWESSPHLGGTRLGPYIRPWGGCQTHGQWPGVAWPPGDRSLEPEASLEAAGRYRRWMV
ncbi:Hypothetical protein AA314_05576 [Archangium gephyra]|uniref:Uncharacterized protein n=1 Tax=Archangium gephyra TaxID=48 RepID=A0AAC8QAU4_9BACT|nr:Hypothetical protein AA314_05576 [Archangium gephyra]